MSHIFFYLRCVHFLGVTQRLTDSHVSLYNVLGHCVLTLSSVLESNYNTQREYERIQSSKNEHFCVLNDKKVHKMTIVHSL